LGAVLGAAETENQKMPATLDAAALSEMAARPEQRRRSVALGDQTDALLVPDLEACNMRAKQLIYFAGATVADLVLRVRRSSWRTGPAG
jgi:phosphate acetyltransferase